MTPAADQVGARTLIRSEEHTSELQSQSNLVCRLLLEKKKKTECQPTIAPRYRTRFPTTTITEHSSPPHMSITLPLSACRRTSHTVACPRATHEQLAV